MEMDKMLSIMGLQRHPIYKDYASDIMGNVFSLKFGNIKQRRLAKHGRGYLQFAVSLKKDGQKMLLAHRFVYECWFGKIKGDLQINHYDGNKKNNALANLELMTDLENKKHGISIGVLYGAANPNHPFYWR